MYIKNNLDCDISNMLINNDPSFLIYRESSSRAYFLTLPNIIVLAVCKKDLEDFELLYGDSFEYLFDVYETERYYHIVCMSKYSESDISEWLYANEASVKYINLYKLYGSCFVMNKPWYAPLNQPFQTDYKFLKYIGQGKRITEISDLIKHVMHLINHEYKFLPNHYLSFP